MTVTDILVVVVNALAADSAVQWQAVDVCVCS